MGVKKFGHIKKIKIKLAAAFEIVNICPISFHLRLKMKKNQIKKILKLL